MAKKNLHGLMSGILGSDNSDNEKMEALASVVDNNAETSAKTSPEKKTKKSGHDKTRATFVISAETLRKIKYIALVSDCLQLEIVGDALSEYIQRWEKENGPINLKKK